MRAPEWSLRAELSEIAASPGSVGQRAQDSLEALGGVVPYAAAWIGVRDPETRQHRPVATQGHTEPLARYFALPDADDDLEQLGLNRLRPPMCARDLPAPLADIRAWGEYLLPAGFQDGFAMGLFSADGRHLGFISLLTDDPAERTTAYRGIVEALRPLLAQAVDRLPSLASVARLAPDAVGGVALTRAGRTLPLPGLPEHPLLASGSTVTAVARELLTAPGTHASFLCPFPEAPGGLVRITVLDCGDQPPDHLSALLLVRRVAVPQGLRLTDLQMFGALLQGWHVEQITARLPGPHPAVRLPRLAAELQLRSPRHLLLHVAREGYYVPPPLWDTSLAWGHAGVLSDRGT
jgi:hypothetical protein